VTLRSNFCFVLRDIAGWEGKLDETQRLIAEVYHCISGQGASEIAKASAFSLSRWGYDI